MIGFSYYNVVPSIAPTTQEILAALTGTQKIAILNGFVHSTPVTELRHDSGVHPYAIRHLYRKIDEIEERARVLMRGEVVVIPEVIDTPAVYNIPPDDAAELLSLVQDDFAGDFTAAQVTAILTKMVEYSKHDGTGNWAYYSAEVVK